MGTAARLETLLAYVRGCLERKEFVEDGHAMDIDIRSPKGVVKEGPRIAPRSIQSFACLVLGLFLQWLLTHGSLNWVRIAQTLGSRTPKQCRGRYHQNLKPSLNHDPITPEDGLRIERLVHEIGKRWAEIARRLHGRSENAVKNWWNNSKNRRRRVDRRRAVQIYDDHYTDNRSRLSISTPALSMPRTQLSPLSAPRHHHPVPWVGAPLPSPCSSESAEPDAGSNYTPSPARHPISLHMPVELPPIRNAPVPTSVDPKLPSLSSLASPLFGDGA
ncbi:hypothetical protein IL306_001814 [Fusarium sp. DS 682]|nr:hypothetical protein IL306_001814 [Fusarium sp. DS 682]